MNELTRDMLEDGVDEDGYADDPLSDGEVGVQTMYCPLMAIIRVEVQGADLGYLRVIGDYPGEQVEIRIPVEAMVAAGWTPPPPIDGDFSPSSAPAPEALQR